MRIRTKVILLLVLLGAIFTAGRHFYRSLEDRRMYALFKENMEERNTYLDNLLSLKEASLKALVFDYTYWDEMVDFVGSRGGIEWAQKNIDENALKTYQADAIWVYRLDLSPAYYVASDAAGLEQLVIPKEEIKKIFSESAFCHFFVNTPVGLMEIRGATIHPSADAKRKTPVRGYFFAGRLWDKHYIDDLGRLLGGQVKISATEQAVPPFDVLVKTSTIIFSRELPGWQGKSAAYFYVSIESKELEIYKVFSRNAAIIFIGFPISVIIFIVVFLKGALEEPFAIITRALKTENPDNLRSLEKDTSEFGDIARLISKFFKQRETLVKEISERKKAEHDLRDSRDILEYQKKSLEEVNKELDDFTYIVSHDLKEPLRSIDAYSKFIEDDYKEKLNEEGRHYLERVRANTERMKRLIEDLLELSRLKKKGSVIEEIPAGDLISEARMRLEYAIKQKNAEIIVQDNLPRVFCDRVRLTEVFLNLISNAIKFNDKPKPVIEIGYSDKGDLYEFYVKDNGTGIEKEYFKKIFEIFQRLGRREDAEGTGAGLTIAKKIVHIHRGDIRVDSKLKEGSVFYFTIPKNKEMVIGKKLIGEILLEKNFISEENLKAALEEQKKSSMPHKKEEDK
ncbi:MAG: ATP-binding protein [Candidatus Omnitrophica bacterium]|nr:ATP-binding protein [Candidatus Omnitrophota bacterium]MDD5512351.1 ATP-binding protein [Candidatus Omnitrophota bacterium]